MGPPLFKRITFLGRIGDGGPGKPLTPLEGNSTQKKRMTPTQLPRACPPQHQKVKSTKATTIQVQSFKTGLSSMALPVRGPTVGPEQGIACARGCYFCYWSAIWQCLTVDTAHGELSGSALLWALTSDCGHLLK
jgi:hypothetical protein